MAVLLGGSVAYAPAPQHTVELDRLSDAMGALEIDFAVTAPHYQTDTNHPYASDTRYSLGQGAMANTLPIETVTFSLPGTTIAKGYLYDFYFRVHSSITNLVLNNVLSEQVFVIELWSAWLTNYGFDTLAATNLPDATLLLPISVPYIFKPLETVSGTINVAALGVPTIDGFYTLTFDQQVMVIPVTGQRVVVWPFVPQTSFTERKEWLTDVIPARHGEQRLALREIPREVLSYNYIFKSVEEFSRAKSIAHTYAHLSLATPLWTDVVRLSNLVLGQTVIPFTTSFLSLEVDSIVIFWTSFTSYEVGEVLAIDSSSITLKQGLRADRANCWIAPVFIGYINEGINLVRNANGKNEASLSYNCTNNFPVVAPAASGESYLGLPVVTFKSVVTGGLAERYERETTTFDSETGGFVRFDLDDYNRGKHFISIKATSREELYTIRQYFNYLQGKFRPFWLPSYNQDLIPVETLNIGASSIKVKFAGWSTYGVHTIRVTGSSTAYFAVTGAIDNFDGTEQLSIVPNSPATITNITRIDIMTKVRLDADGVEFSHANKITTVKAAVVEIL